MATEALIFKGIGRGPRRKLAISIPHDMGFDELLAGLRARLGESQGFFRGAPVVLEGKPLTGEERRKVRDLVAEFGLLLTDEPALDGEGGASPWPGPKPAPAAAESGPEVPWMEIPADDQTLLVRRTLRSGQRIFFAGNVVVLGDVNPGAMVTCTGDIAVMGRLRGVAHAGAGGNVAARVMAFRLEPTQLRIAHYISRAPDGEEKGPDWPEMAFISNGVIEIQAFNP